MRTVFVIVLLFSSLLLHAQTSSVSVRVDSSYNGWGWKSIVMQNDIIALATVPAIGARVMKYDLGSLPSLYVNSSELGRTYIPSQNGSWHNFGGFKTWPAPQSQWNAGGWPPPPILDCGSYAFQIDSMSLPGDSVVLTVSSPTEKWFSPNIRFERTATVFAGTSRIRMDQRMINEGTSTVTWSVWGVSQSIVNHVGKSDYSNYWVYFPINPNSHYGTSGVSPQGNSNAWKGQIAPGVYGVQFSPDNQKIFADPDKGWIAYADVSDTVVFAKTFELFEGAQYPDDGARVTVYVSGNAPPNYLEVEVKGPIVQLEANGGNYSFTENWWAARVRAPILSIDSVGAVAKRLSLDTIARVFSGTYGVFYQGSAAVEFFDGSGNFLSGGPSHPTTPLTELQLQDTLSIPAGAVSMEVRVYDRKSRLVGVLDAASVSALLTDAPGQTYTAPSEFLLAPNYPNPFNGGTVLMVACPKATRGSLKIYDVLGREVATLSDGELSAGSHRFVWNPLRISSGIYIARLELPGSWQTQKLIYLR